MVSARLDGMVSGDVQRTYLGAIDGYWADLVLSEFAFLEERGGTINELAFHQKGDYVLYKGPWGSVALEFTPDNYPATWIDGTARLRGRSASFEGTLDRLVSERAPDFVPPPLAPLDESTVARSLRAWSEVLRSATDLF
jgi:hypothetical protein